MFLEGWSLCPRACLLLAFLQFGRGTAAGLPAWYGECDCIRSTLCSFIATSVGEPCPTCQLLGKQSLHQLSRCACRSPGRVPPELLGKAELLVRLAAAEEAIGEFQAENRSLANDSRRLGAQLVASRCALEALARQHPRNTQLLRLLDLAYQAGEDDAVLRMPMAFQGCVVCEPGRVLPYLDMPGRLSDQCRWQRHSAYWLCC